MTIETINPATGERINSYPEMTVDEVNQRIEQSHQAHLAWKDVSFVERAKKMQAAAKLLRENQEDYAHIITEEMGKPIKQARGEIGKCALVCEHYANHSAEYLAPRTIASDLRKSYVTYQPLGIIFAIMPWNFPFWQVFRFAAPNLMAGNVGLLKHAPISTGAALAIESIFRDAGFPEGAFSSLVIDVDLATHVINHPFVAAVTLTGSERAGQAVGAAAGKALKQVVLELGGSDPYLILEDADLHLAAQQAVASRLNNAGQVCIAAKRIIAVEPIFEAFQEIVMTEVEKYSLGNPLDDTCTMGPIAREDLRKEVHQQVQASIAEGAINLTGGTLPEGPGFYYPPTVLSNVTPGMSAFDQEIFGPVVTLIRAKDEAEAIQLANHTSFGLAGAVFTQDLARGERIAAEKINAGSCFVNRLVASNPVLPFGGIKSSGYGRELSAEGIRAFTNVKTIGVG